MYHVYDWAEVRVLKRQDRSIAAIAKQLDMSRNTVYRLASMSDPPAYVRPLRPSLLDPHKDKIRSLLREDATIPATVILERIAADGYAGKITILKEHVARIRPEFLPPELFQRTVYVPGDIAQFDWWEPGVSVDVGKGHIREVFGLVGVLPYSSVHAVVFTLAETTADFVSALPDMLERLGGLPQAAVFDRDSSIVVPRTRRVHPEVASLLGALAIRPIVLPPRKPQSKGAVERANGYLETSFMPARHFADLADLQAQADTWAVDVAFKRHHRRLGTRPEVAAVTERSHMAPLPEVWPDTDRKLEVRVSRDSFVRAGGVDYSVPPGFARRLVHASLSPRECIVVCEGREIARHVRSFVPADVVRDPAHEEALTAAKEARARLRDGDVDVASIDLSCYDALVAVV